MTSTVQGELFATTSELSTPAVGLFADIVFDRPLDHAYSYGVPETLRGRLAVGKRVLAPFGKGDKATVGFCVGISKVGPEREVKTLLRVLDDEALITPDLMRLTRWMADYYLCGWGQVLNSVLPAGAKQQSGTRSVTYLEAVPEAELPEPPPTLTAKQASVLAALREAGKPLEPKRLAAVAQCGSGPIGALIGKKLVRRVTRRVDAFTAAVEDAPSPTAALTLNADQLRAWAPIEQAVRTGSFQAMLLHGVTGSGKTELYLRAIAEVVRQGKEALVLVPEISLTPQTIAQFQGRLGEVAVLHSHLGDAERGHHWRRVANGQVQVVVGARSAVFAPARQLGLIIVDEEHETSFKQEQTPRYHARDVAVMRARLENIPIILGSATPSLESWHNAEKGQYSLLTLPNRVLDLPLPEVALLDQRHERRVGKWRALGPSLERAIRDTLRDQGQVILLLNRRGFSTHVHCPACGHVESCKFCDVALTYHRERDVLLCHACGFEAAPVENCTQCSQKTVKYQGLGTEKLQAEVEELFPGSVVRRMDSDTMKRPGSHAKVLAAFRNGLIHILLGTQMIAKGLDFPNVTLVGVVNADVGLHLPDFRAAERTFQLLSQVAGRAGRGPRGGRVLVQTFNPEHPSIVHAARHDYTGFVGIELPHRLAHHYPPYHRLARLIIRSKKQEAAAAFADRLAGIFQTALSRAGSADIRLLGPAEAPVFRLKNYYRFHFQLQSPTPGALHQLLRAILATARVPAGVEFTVDIDPYSML